MKVVVVRNLYQLVGITCRGLPSLPLASALVSVLPRDSPGQIFTSSIGLREFRQTGHVGLGSIGLGQDLLFLPQASAESHLIEGPNQRLGSASRSCDKWFFIIRLFLSFWDNSDSCC